MHKYPPAERAIHVIVGVSAENGIEFISIFQHSANYITFFEAIHLIRDRQNFVLLEDNAHDIKVLLQMKDCG